MSTSPYSGKVYGTATPGRSTTPTVSSKKTSSSSSGNTLTPAEIAAGYSTVSGPYDPKTGKLKTVEKTTQAIDTTQPSPTTTQINPTNTTPVAPTKDIVNFDFKTGEALAPGASTTDALGNVFTQGQQFKQGFQDTVSKGIEAPQTQGEANLTTKQSIIPEKEDTSIIDAFLEEDKGFQEIKDNYAEYYSPENQKTSLMDTYNELFKDAGLSQLDEEILDAQTIIDGTEDDIRNEVEQAGGFATDSQVQALSLSRNKVLLKNYNNLVALRESKATNLNTMMSLAEKDRTYADNQVDRMFNYETKMLEYRNKFIQNALDQYNKYEPAQLYSMLADNPRQLAFAEAIMGLSEGGLEKVANAPLSLKDQLLTEQIKTEKAQREKIYEDINQVNETGTISGKPQNASQSAANSYANRLAEANIAINNLGNQFTGKLSQLPMFNFMKSSDRQVYEQAQKNFITAVLRRESGASIAPSEFDTAADVYFPQPGDSSEVVKQKAQTRNIVINNFYREANVLRPVMAGDIIESNGKEYKVGLDGETLEEI